MKKLSIIILSAVLTGLMIIPLNSVNAARVSQKLNSSAMSSANVQTLRKYDFSRMPVLQYNSHGQYVYDLHLYLNIVAKKYGVACSTLSSAEDYNFGNDTLAAVKEFQRWADLNPDGIVGPSTWKALENTLNNRPN